MANTFQKSAKGSQALAARDPALTQKLRSLLIMVDGKRTPEDLAKVAAALGDPQQMLSQLLDLGFIEGSMPPAPTAAAPAAAPTPAQPVASSAPAVPLKEAQRFAVRRITDLLGPPGETLCLRIEAARTPAEFTQALHRAEQVLRDFGGQRLADSFLRDMDGHLPG